MVTFTRQLGEAMAPRYSSNTSLDVAVEVFVNMRLRF